MKEPQAGEYWQHKTHTKDRAYFIGRTPEGEMVWQCEGDTIESGNLDWSGWQHLPDCDSWDWQPNEYPKYWTTLKPDAYAFVKQTSKNRCVLVLKNGQDDLVEWWTDASQAGRTPLTKEQAEGLIDKPQESPVVDPGEGWELLPKGTVLRTGDQVYMKGMTDHSWVDTCYPGQIVGSREWLDAQYRRKITPQESPTRVPLRLWCRYERGNKTGHMYVFANTEPPVGAGIKYSEIKSDGNGGWYVEVQP
jgi:hypothetical protein